MSTVLFSIRSRRSDTGCVRSSLLPLMHGCIVTPDGFSPRLVASDALSSLVEYQNQYRFLLRCSALMPRYISPQGTSFQRIPPRSASFDARTHRASSAEAFFLSGAQRVMVYFQLIGRAKEAYTGRHEVCSILISLIQQTPSPLTAAGRTTEPGADDCVREGGIKSIHQATTIRSIHSRLHPPAGPFRRTAAGWNFFSGADFCT
jgi:hypothetical protein